MRRSLIVVLGLVLTLIMIWQCDSSTPEKITYLNHADSVKYVGIHTCKQCHIDKFKTFQHTGMGMSFGEANSAKSVGAFHGDFVNDPFLDFNYQPFWNGDSLFLKEFRVTKEDTVFKRVEKVDYIIGSGQHTNSHLTNDNGYIHQMPFTFYAQSGKLDLPPGFEEGQNSRFKRLIGLECMSCHNAMPVNFVKGSENKFEKVPLGIDCERCHGPGEAHVAKIMKGDFTDTATSIDYSIVNPKKLDVQLQFELCQRCHLQGNAVLKEGKSFFDFKPGMALNEVMDVYLPRYTHSDEDFIMASHVDRFKQSDCFKQSMNTFLCTSCHNPHISVKETAIESFNAKCENCHNAGKTECSENETARTLKSDNCVECHMPSSGSIDIPHVTVHDHYIRKPVDEKKVNGLKTFLKLEAVNNKNPSKRSRINAYLQQFEKFESNPVYLDSAHVLLFKNGVSDTNLYKEVVLYFHLRNMPNQLLNWIRTNLNHSILNDLDNQTYSNSDAWCAYRIGEAHTQLGFYNEAIQYVKRAVKLAPYISEFKLKLGGAYFNNGQIDEAKITYENILIEQPKTEEALSNLGYIYILNENFNRAQTLLEKSLDLNPDYEEAQLNLASLYIATGRNSKAHHLLLSVLERNPSNEKVKAAINYLEGINE